MSALLCQRDDRGVLTLTLNRPSLHNAFDDALIADITEALIRYAQDPEIRVLVLKAGGKHFSAGADLAWMQRMAAYSPAENQRDAEKLEAMMRQLYHFPKPAIAVVQGAAYGGAVGLVSCCDIAVASEQAIFCLSEVKIGLAPAVISPYVQAAIGRRQASRYFLTGERFDATEARRLGLVHEVVNADALEASCAAFVASILENGPQAVSACKALLHHLDTAAPESLPDYTSQLIARLRTSAEGQEGLSAFLEKRLPAWRNGAR